MKVIVFILSVYSLSNIPSNKRNLSKTENRVSNFAYKLPYRGENYKFYGTISYHVIGRAYVNNKVHNSIVESFKISENNCKNISFRIYSCTKRNFGYLQKSTEQKNGFSAILMTPIKKNNKSVKHYYRNWVFSFINNYDKNGKSKYGNKSIDFNSMSQYILNLDNAARIYNLKIKKIIFNRHFLKQLYASKSGKELKSRDIYFAKYISKKVNKKYDDLFYIEFEPIK